MLGTVTGYNRRVAEDLEYAGRLYRVARHGGGLFFAISVWDDDARLWRDVFAAQGDDAAEWSDMWNEHGAYAVLVNLDTAGVNMTGQEG